MPSYRLWKIPIIVIPISGHLLFLLEIQNKITNLGVQMRKLSYLFLLMLFCYSFLQAQEAEETDIFFRYGLVAIEAANEDSVYIIEENTELTEGDKIRLNLEYQKGKFLYVVYESPEKEFQMLFASTSFDLKTKSDSIFTALPWMEIENPNAEEKFFMISSDEPLVNLENNYRNYVKSTGKNRKKFHKQLENDIANLHIGKLGHNNSEMVSRLEEPIIGGVTFRGKAAFILTEQSLTYQCKGKSVAVATFTIKKK